jgi:hypothetical protein
MGKNVLIIRQCKETGKKCDGGRPSCSRCINSQIKCGAYDYLVWKQPVVAQSSVPTLSKLEIAKPRALSAGFRFRNEHDYQYFALFQNEVSHELSAGFDSTIWDRLVLQTCNYTPIFQLALSIAALNKSTKLLDSNEADGSSGGHRRFALTQYSKALSGLRKLLAEKSKNSLRLSLFAALLIFVIENMLGNMFGAAVNIQSAFMLLRQHVASKLDTEVKMHFNDTLLNQFRLLDRSTYTVMWTWSTEEPPQPKDYFDRNYYDQEDAIPVAFSTMDEARTYLEAINFRAMEYCTQRKSYTQTCLQAELLMPNTFANANHPPLDHFQSY